MTTGFANLRFTKPPESGTQIPQPSQRNNSNDEDVTEGDDAYHGDLVDIGVLLLVVLPELLPAGNKHTKSIRTHNPPKQREKTQQKQKQRGSTLT